MYNTFLKITAALSLLAATAIGQETPKVQVEAEIQPQSSHEIDLVVRANIAPGLHIYAQTQPKPFLATKFTVKPNPLIKSVGEFVVNKTPLMLRHESLGVELHEHEDGVEWRSRIRISGELAAGNLVIEGSVFAQACEADRCFAPQTYAFSAETQIPAKTVGTSIDLAATLETTPETKFAANEFSLDNLAVETTESKTAWNVLPLAFVAGFLLNFMPCVLPVVGLKLLSFVQQADSDRKRILLMNLSYTAGLLSVMLILATLAVFAGLGWGEQFSSAAFTVTLSTIVFAFGLSFLGVWEIPLPGFVGDASGQMKQEGYGGAFSKGVLSTLLATPCSGPFLGAALAWAVTQPTYLTYAVFAAVGLGMASPYLIAGLFPSAIRFLPKPGNWMVTFKQIMGFIMLGTVVYLMSFMPIAAVVPTVLLLLGVGLALWFAGRTPMYAPPKEQIKAWGGATAIIAVTALASFGWLQGVMQARFERAVERLLANSGAETTLVAKRHADENAIDWQPYSAARLEELVRAGTPVFVDFTADWCLTCKSNEAAAIETPEFAEALRAGKLVALRADKTEPNPEADALLRMLGNSAASIPNGVPKTSITCLVVPPRISKVNWDPIENPIPELLQASKPAVLLRQLHCGVTIGHGFVRAANLPIRIVQYNAAEGDGCRAKRAVRPSPTRYTCEYSRTYQISNSTFEQAIASPAIGINVPYNQAVKFKARRKPFRKRVLAINGQASIGIPNTTTACSNGGTLDTSARFLKNIVSAA